MSDDVGTLVDEVDELRQFKTDLIGTSGNNGRLGVMRGEVSNLRSEIATIKKGLLAVTIAAIGALGGAGGAVYAAAKESGAKDQRLEFLERQVQENRDEIRLLRSERRWNRSTGDE